jgi:RimJ/RimL family protein N-acetyltransferase
MIRETERLELVPLTLSQLKLWTGVMNEFEKELNCTYKAQPLVDFILDNVEEQIVAITNDNNNYLFYTSWLIICKSDRIAVGSAAFKGTPNSNGEIEIGYGLGEEFEHNGYMTEAVEEMCKWGLKQENVKHIIAETDIDGYASQRILERNGFERYKFDETSWWKL